MPELVSVSAPLRYLLTHVPCVFSIAFPSPLKQTQVGFVTLQTKEWLPSLWPREFLFAPPKRGFPCPPPQTLLSALVLRLQPREWEAQRGRLGNVRLGQRQPCHACTIPVTPAPSPWLPHLRIAGPSLENAWNSPQAAQEAILSQVTCWIGLLGQGDGLWMQSPSWPGKERDGSFIARFPTDTAGLRREATQEGYPSWILEEMLRKEAK